MGKALAEAVERYCSANWIDSAETCAISAGDSPFYSRLPRCADFENCPEGFKGVTPEVRLTHCRMNELETGKTVYIPAGFALQRFRTSADEPLIGVATSSGTAFHTDFASALMACICELIERDAAMDYWLQRRVKSRILLKHRQIPIALSDRLQRLERASIKAFLFDISSDIPVPAVLCVLSSDRYPYWSFGTACNTGVGQACVRAMDEAIAVRFKQIFSSARHNVVSRQDFSWVKSFSHHSELYASWADCPALEFFMKNSKPIHYAAFEEKNWQQGSADLESLQKLSRHLSDAGMTVLWSDITSEDARQFGTCIKAVIPELIPLSSDFSARWLATKRLFRDNSSNSKGKDRFNPFPHPFG